MSATQTATRPTVTRLPSYANGTSTVPLLGLFCGLASLFPWLPQIIKTFGLPASQVGLVTAIPPIAGLIGMIVLSRHSDHVGERTAAFGTALALGVWFVAASDSNSQQANGGKVGAYNAAILDLAEGKGNAEDIAKKADLGDVRRAVPR